MLGSLVCAAVFWTEPGRAQGTMAWERYQLDLRNGRAEAVNYRGAPALKLTEAKPGQGGAFAVVNDLTFHNGNLELEVSGAPSKTADPSARGFIGIVFRMEDGSHYEIIYLRPTNARADDQLRRNHTTQYASEPDWPWERLRKETPGQYESYADVAPGEWTRLRIEVNGSKAVLYVGGAAEPALIVRDLKRGDGKGAVGLWAGPGTEGYFRGLAIADGQTKEAAYGSNPGAAHYLRNGSARIYYETYGEGGRPLVLLHGGLYGSIGEFSPLIDCFRRDRKVIAIATRGHGSADMGDEPFSYRLFAEDAAKVIEHETRDEVDLFGFSQGAITAYVLASSRPELIHRLVAVGGRLDLSGATGKVMEEYKNLNAADIERDLDKNDPGFVAQRKKMMPDPSRWNEFLDRLAKLWSAQVYVSDAQIEAIACPTLVVAGERDPYVRAEHLLRIRGLLRHGQVAIVPGCGHVVLMENPRLMLDMTARFLSEENSN